MCLFHNLLIIINEKGKETHSIMSEASSVLLIKYYNIFTENLDK